MKKWVNRNHFMFFPAKKIRKKGIKERKLKETPFLVKLREIHSEIFHKYIVFQN